MGNAHGAGSVDLGCKVCDAGSFSAGVASESCTPCSPGYFRSDSNVDKHGFALPCLPCAAGSYSNQASLISSSLCKVCEQGKYNPTPGQTSSGCLLCPPGRWGTKPNASQLEDCEDCAAGYVSSQAGSTQCALCGELAEALRRTTAGFFLQLTPPPFCHTHHPKKYVQPVGATAAPTRQHACFALPGTVQ